eukprot:5130442-Pyramimonas_sp.AAC.1
MPPVAPDERAGAGRHACLRAVGASPGRTRRGTPSLLALLRLLAPAALVEVGAAVLDLLRGPRQHQAVHAVVVAGVAVVDVGVRGGRLARGRQARGGRQLRGAPPVGRLAAESAGPRPPGCEASGRPPLGLAAAFGSRLKATTA